MFEVKVTISAPELVQAINNLTAALTGVKPAQTPQQQAPAPAPISQQPAQPTGVPVTEPPQYTIDQIMKGGAALMDAGRVDDLMNLLHSFGVVAVTDLKPEQLGAFATALRGLGAKI